MSPARPIVNLLFIGCLSWAFLLCAVRGFLDFVHFVIVHGQAFLFHRLGVG